MLDKFELAAFCMNLVRSAVAADILGIDKRTLHRAADRGDVPGFRIDGERYFDRRVLASIEYRDPTKPGRPASGASLRRREAIRKLFLEDAAA